MVAPPGDVEPLALKVTSSGALPDIGVAVNAAVGAGTDGNVTAGTARHSASALGVQDDVGADDRADDRRARAGTVP